MTASENVDIMVMKLGSGHSTPSPTIDASDTAIPIEFLSVWLKRSVTSS
eukprot:CAMPEP_0202955830 /NCGR_PEP_ID=MMETSP1396-20130829/339_1 /ASSEMBLY_ACC=CAM_ASM_000872 /TAXON_ID= /ORGANISM="Pseudokeronopsis sp., Strain Brazil" /LENGTH=48 /DNA_ID= /DNA_START= /DNA_END= /DNA_ORIENTATION=